MRHRGQWLILSMVVAVAALLAPAVSAQDAVAQEKSAPSTNVAITITVGDTVPEDGEGPDERNFRMVMLAAGRSTNLLVGWRMPIPSTRQPDDDPDAAPVTSYIYQNVGMSARLKPSRLEDVRFLVVGSIEVSGKRNEPEAERNEAGLPIIGTFQQDIYLVLRDGKKLRVAEVPDPEGGMIYIELQLDVMK